MSNATKKVSCMQGYDEIGERYGLEAKRMAIAHTQRKARLREFKRRGIPTLESLKR